VKIPQEFI